MCFLLPINMDVFVKHYHHYDVANIFVSIRTFGS
jgi:hypothetical protein